MAAKKVGDFRASALAEWFHSSIHRDFNLEATTTIFTPNDKSYYQALIVLAIFVASFGILLIVSLLLFFCCYCFKKQPQLLSGTYYSRKSCLKYFIFTISTICSAAIIVGYVYNSQTSVGVDDFGNNVVKIQASLKSASAQGEKLEGVLEDVYSLISQLADHPEVHGAVKDALRQSSLMENEIRSVNDIIPVSVGNTGDSFREHMKHYDNYRWLTTISVLTWCLLLFLFCWWICCQTNLCVMITLTTLLFSSLLFAWILLGTSFGLAVGTGDFCVDPASAIKNQTSPHDPVKSAVIDYYLTCEDLDPFTRYLEHFAEENRTVTNIIQEIYDDHEKYQKEALEILQRLQNIGSLFAMYKESLSCWKIHGKYLDAMDSLCNKTLTGLAVVILALFIVAFFSGIMACAVGPLWNYRKSYNRAYRNIDVDTGDNGVLWWPEDIRPDSNNDEQPQHYYIEPETNPLVHNQPSVSVPIHERFNNDPRDKIATKTNEVPF